ncbi:protein scribble homolog [Clupea harengus]|uniref:Protein scribble homolog n=1 Tax=Clupea harengus TaxID=7950 RepID=A0A6P8GJE8_CLUHA|nr:protein scribble homolog [Clupea harengus]
MKPIWLWYPEKGTRAAKPAVNSGGGNGRSSGSGVASQTWTLPSLRWVSGKEPPQGGLNLNHVPASDGVRARNSNPEKEAEELPSGTDENITAHFSEAKPPGRGLRHHRCDLRQDSRKLPRCRAMKSALCHHRDAPAEPSEPVPEKAPVLNKSFISQVPLRLQIKVNGQRGSLGISIAGGKGSLPYKEHDEGIFISRVSKGGPAERAGVHVGDRVLEVNGLDMQVVTHHEAVSALRNAGSCIKMKVLRSRALPPELCALAEDPVIRETGLVIGKQHDPGNSSSGGGGGGGGRGGGSSRPQPKQPKVEPAALDYSLSKRIEAVVMCNGNGVNWSTAEPGQGRSMKDTGASFKNNALQVMENTITIPRIILTHPSTSDEDIEPLTPSADEGDLDDLDDPDSHLYSECLSSAFHPP